MFLIHLPSELPSGLKEHQVFTVASFDVLCKGRCLDFLQVILLLDICGAPLASP